MVVSDAFLSALSDLGRRRSTNPLVFLDVWNAESSLNPAAENASSHAQGLNQMMPATLRGLGAPSDFKSLSGAEQIPWIERLIAGGEKLNGGPFATPERYYHSNFFPRTMPRGQSPSTVVVARDATDPDERAAYAANVGLDFDASGSITYADLSRFLALRKAMNAATYNDARARLAAPAIDAGPAPISTVRKVVATSLLGIGAGVTLAHFYPLPRRRRLVAAASRPRKVLAMPKKMESEYAIAGAVGLVGVVVAAVVARRASAPTPTPPKPPPPPPTVGNWIAATTIQPGDLVRASMPQATFNGLAMGYPGLPPGLPGWTQLLSQVSTALTGSSNVTLLAYAPGDALPTDWPTDDVDRATEYHVQFVYYGKAPVLVSALPIPVRAWTNQPVGVKPPPVLPPPPPPITRVWHRVGANGQTPAGHTVYTAIRSGDLARVSIDPVSLRQQALAQNYAPNELGLVQLIQKTWTDSTFPMLGINVTTFVPGAPLPSDWPTDDAAAATEYHAQFVYGGPLTHTRPDNVIMWVASTS